MEVRIVVLRVVTFGLLFFLSGCSIYSVPGSAPVPVESEPDYTEVEPPLQPSEPAVRESQASAAYAPLLAKAEQATARGDYEQAFALLERAQRIEPNSAKIYLAMAKTHDARGDYTQADATAQRGLLYCVSKPQCDELRRFTL